MASKKNSVKATGKLPKKKVSRVGAPVVKPLAPVVLGSAPAKGHFSRVRVEVSKTERRQYTGRVLVRLNPDVALPSSLHLVNMQDFAEKGLEAGLSTALEQADGVLFGRLGVAVVNERASAKVSRLQESADKPFLSVERERYIYKNGKAPLKNTAAATWGIQAINVRNSPLTGKDVRIAVLDTGFDFTHPDFSGRTIHRKAFAGRQAKDREGHGTFCVGIAGGGRKGKTGARYGVAPDARLYVGRILDNAGEGSDGLALAGIEWALEKECRVISMSFGAAVEKGAAFSAIFEDVARTALANRCLLIAATGNESDREEGLISPVNHPANCPSIIAVAALTESLKVANYSCGSKGQVTIAAPGDEILSCCMGGGYDTESGTSMATPFVAGVAALLWEAYPDASAKDIWKLLTRQAKPLGLPAADVGAGLVYVP